MSVSQSRRKRTTSRYTSLWLFVPQRGKEERAKSRNGRRITDGETKFCRLHFHPCVLRFKGSLLSLTTSCAVEKYFVMNTYEQTHLHPSVLRLYSSPLSSLIVTILPLTTITSPRPTRLSMATCPAQIIHNLWPTSTDYHQQSQKASFWLDRTSPYFTRPKF